MKPSFEQLKEVTQGYDVLCVVPSSNNANNLRSLQAYYYNSQVNAYVWKYVTLNDNGVFTTRILAFQAQTQLGEILSLNCLTEDDLIVYPQGQVYFPLFSIAILVFIFTLLYKIIIKRLLP